MLRRLIAATFILSPAAVLHAQHSATLILTSGERVTGVVGYQGDAVPGQPRRAFQVITPDGQHASVAFDEVAVIDFVGGRPTIAELDALGADAPHVLTLRNGNLRRGRLAALVGGEFVRWENEAGARMDIPVRNVNRVFLHAESALAQFDTRPRPPVSGLTGWLERGFLGRPEVIVSAGTPWTDAGVVVRRGELVTFSVTGGIALTRDGSQAGPAGVNGPGAHLPVPDWPTGALIGRVGAGRPFGIGGAPAAIAMPASGRLLLGINDDTLEDNSGAFRVVITR